MHPSLRLEVRRGLAYVKVYVLNLIIFFILKFTNVFYRGKSIYRTVVVNGMGPLCGMIHDPLFLASV